MGEALRIFSGIGRIVSITSLIDEASPPSDHQTVVYNLKMAEGPPNFLVNGIVVHNGDGDGGK